MTTRTEEEQAAVDALFEKYPPGHHVRHWLDNTPPAELTAMALSEKVAAARRAAIVPQSLATERPTAIRDWPREEINPNAQKWTFAPVPLWLLQREEVPPDAKLLYARLMLHAGKNGNASANQATLAEEIGISTRQVRRLVKLLEDLNLVRAKRRGFGGDNGYTFLSHEWQQEQNYSLATMPLKQRQNGAGA